MGFTQEWLSEGTFACSLLSIYPWDPAPYENRAVCHDSVFWQDHVLRFSHNSWEVLWKRLMLTRLCGCNILILQNRLSRNILLKNHAFLSVIPVWLFPSFGHTQLLQLLRNLQRNEFHKSPNLSFFHLNSKSLGLLFPGIKATLVRECGLHAELNADHTDTQFFLYYLYTIIFTNTFFIFISFYHQILCKMSHVFEVWSNIVKNDGLLCCTSQI